MHHELARTDVDVPALDRRGWVVLGSFTCLHFRHLYFRHLHFRHLHFRHPLLRLSCNHEDLAPLAVPCPTSLVVVHSCWPLRSLVRRQERVGERRVRLVPEAGWQVGTACDCDAVWCCSLVLESSM